MIGGRGPVLPFPAPGLELRFVNMSCVFDNTILGSISPPLSFLDHLILPRLHLENREGRSLDSSCLSPIPLHFPALFSYSLHFPSTSSFLLQLLTDNLPSLAPLYSFFFPPCVDTGCDVRFIPFVLRKSSFRTYIRGFALPTPFYSFFVTLSVRLSFVCFPSLRRLRPFLRIFIILVVVFVDPVPYLSRLRPPVSPRRQSLFVSKVTSTPDCIDVLPSLTRFFVCLWHLKYQIIIPNGASNMWLPNGRK